MTHVAETTDTSRFVIANQNYAMAFVGTEAEPLTKVERKVANAVTRAFPMARSMMFEFFQCDGTCGDGPPGEIHHLVRVALDVSLWDMITLVRNLEAIYKGVARAYGQDTDVKVTRLRRSTRASVAAALKKAELMDRASALMDALRAAASGKPEPEPAQPVEATS